MALVVGGTADVRFKDAAYNDLGVMITADDQVSSNFRMQRLGVALRIGRRA